MSAVNFDLVYPMLAMFLWTFLVMLRNVQVRVSAVLRGELTNEYFELFQGAQPNATIIKTANHLRNLTEVPPLFYIAALAIIFIGRTDGVFVTLAWSYVALRVAHGLVHLPSIRFRRDSFSFFSATSPYWRCG